MNFIHSVKKTPLRFFTLSLLFFISLTGRLSASEPLPWQFGLQPPVSPLARQIYTFHNNLIMPIVGIICVFVILLMLYTCWRFSEKRNKKPSKTTNHELIEIIWTVIPVLILTVIFIPSLKLIWEQEKIADAEMTVKITGNQWFWSYEYPDQENISFDALLIAEEDLPEGGRRLMDTDNALVLPVDTKIRLQITSSDVLHSWSVAAFGIKMDAVPGRLNEVWVEVEKEGVYYGFCSELCGQNHSYMPIMAEIVSKEAFLAWVGQAKERYADKSKQQNTPGLAGVAHLKGSAPAR